MAPTTLIGQRSTTSQAGRVAAQSGFPMRVCELLATLDGAVYVERVALNTPANVNKAKKAIRKAFDVQQKGLGFSFVEFVSTCPTNWGLSPIDSMDFLKEQLIPYYPLGVFKSPKGGEE
jgi:2-oxoglutarate ferredoxin oxidoreductase subunit beta